MARTKTVEYKFDFESLYKRYPRKEGKGRGQRTLAATIKTQEQYDAFSCALQNYIDLCDAEGRELRFIKHWCTFVNNWTDHTTRHKVILAVTKNTAAQAQAARILRGEL